MAAQSKLSMDLLDEPSSVPRCDMLTKIMGTDNFERMTQLGAMQMKKGVPDYRLIVCHMYGLYNMPQEMLHQYVLFMSRIVIRRPDGLNMSVPGDGQFILSCERAFEILSPEFIAFLINGWDSKMASHQCFHDDPSLCMATLWDEFENIRHYPLLAHE
jgi:hypothetical protein